MAIEARTQAGDAGFTLLEVMVAFVIAALASIILYQAAFEGAAESLAAARYQEAVIRAQSRLASIGTLTPLRAEQLSGDDGGGFKWQMNIAAERATGQGLTLYDVQITEAFGDRTVTLATKRLGPTT
jgi:general secretion pathway protein I